MDQICGNHLVLDYLKNGMQQACLQNCLLYGPPGSGKTSTLHCLPSCFDSTVMELQVTEMNASNDRRVQDVEFKIRPFFTNPMHPFEVKLLLLDEVDNMTVGAQRLLAHYLEKDSSQFANHRRIVVLACNEIQKVDSLLLSKVLALPFSSVDADSIRLHLESILQSLNTRVHPSDASEFWDILIAKSGGDLRVAINTLHSCYLSAHDQSSNTANSTIQLSHLLSVCSLPANEKITTIVQLILAKQLRRVMAVVRDMESQGYLLLDMLQLLEKQLSIHFLDNQVMQVKVALAFAETYLSFARGCSTMLQVDRCCAAIIKAL